MSLFKQRRPRPFNHKYMYVDERADRLRDIEERAKRDLGMSSAQGYRPDDLRGVFSASQHHRRERGVGHVASVSLPVVAAIVLLLLMVAYCLLA